MIHFEYENKAYRIVPEYQEKFIELFDAFMTNEAISNRLKKKIDALMMEVENNSNIFRLRHVNEFARSLGFIYVTKRLSKRKPAKDKPSPKPIKLKRIKPKVEEVPIDHGADIRASILKQLRGGVAA